MSLGNGVLAQDRMNRRRPQRQLVALDSSDQLTTNATRLTVFIKAQLCFVYKYIDCFM